MREKIFTDEHDITVEVSRGTHHRDYVRFDVNEGLIPHHVFALLTPPQARQMAEWLVAEAAAIDGKPA